MKNIILKIGLIIALFLTQEGRAQNLVSNGSFENIWGTFNSYPAEDFNVLSDVSDLATANMVALFDHTATYKKAWWVEKLINCDAENANTSLNYTAVEGNRYVGLETYPNHDYIVIDLGVPLEAGICYNISFAVRNANDIIAPNHAELFYKSTLTSRRHVGYYTNNIGVYISNIPPSRKRTWDQGEVPLSGNIQPQYNISSIIPSANWQIHEFDYVATGGESKLTFGNFFSASNTTTNGPIDIWLCPHLEKSPDLKGYNLLDYVQVRKKRDIITHIQNETFPSTVAARYGHFVKAGESVVSGPPTGKVIVPPSPVGVSRSILATYAIKLMPGFEANSLFNAYLLTNTCDYSGYINYTPLNRLKASPDELQSENSSIDLSPNPAQNQIIIRGLSNSKAIISIFDITGKIVREYTQEVSQNFQIDISELETGIYILNVLQSNQLHTMKLIKE